MFPLVLFGISGGWIKVIIFVYCVTLAHDMIKLLVVTLIWCLYSALPSALQFRKYLLETINSFFLYLFSSVPIHGGVKRGHFLPPFHLSHLPQASYNGSWKFWIYLGYWTSTFLLLCFLILYTWSSSFSELRTGKKISPVIHVGQTGPAACSYKAGNQAAGITF